ncbi:hypothetical protein ACFL56_02910 [Candidatus Margulisiibacteriota bacterium]
MPKKIIIYKLISKHGRPKLTIEEMDVLAESRGGKCLSTKYINARTKLKWQCEKGHEFEMRPKEVKIGQWCPECSNKKKGPGKLTIKEMHILAKSKKGKFLSKIYLGSAIKHIWQCEKGHIFKKTPSSVKIGFWCTQCSGMAKLTIQEMKQYAEKRDGKCLSNKYKNNKTKLKFQCKKGHIFMQEPRVVKSGHWCPECGKKKKRLKNV